MSEDTLTGKALEAERMRRLEAFQAYRAECEAENLEHHNMAMWSVHGEPTGPLG